MCDVLARLCALPLLVFGQDMQLSMAAVQASGSPCSQPRLVVHHLERERFGATAREQSGSRVRVWQQCESLNVDLVEPICEGLGCSAGTIGTDMAGVVVAGCTVLRCAASCRVRTPSMPWRPAV